MTLAQVLEHLGLLANLRGQGQQRRGPCPLHSQADDPQRTFSAQARGWLRGPLVSTWQSNPISFARR